MEKKLNTFQKVGMFLVWTAVYLGLAWFIKRAIFGIIN